ncbi:hypothetical protein PHYPSEUDO_006274 [Phytophthora pseudosyringae]|uniref:Uncharacterized protein n=1 Tax=Phytophthora pseudosyringae TaxID=221518 RepID=A0A8T1VM80_9STRA|nr:hypothetical protein PHYPSEUDO_006274 [Phytophthora pseudosyringae]
MGRATANTHSGINRLRLNAKARKEMVERSLQSRGNNRSFFSRLVLCRRRALLPEELFSVQIGDALWGNTDQLSWAGFQPAGGIDQAGFRDGCDGIDTPEEGDHKQQQ